MTQRASNQENSLLTSNEQTLSERLRDCVKVTFSAGLHGVESDCRQAAEELDRQRAEIERLTRELSSEKALRAEAEDFAEDRERHTALVARGGAEIIAERDRLRAALLNHVCNCGPTDPDPSVHREDCAYRLALSGEHASAHETTARRMTRAEADAMNRAFWRSVEIIDDIDNSRSARRANVGSYPTMDQESRSE